MLQLGIGIMTMSSGWSTWFLESGHCSVINMKTKFLKCLFGWSSVALTSVVSAGSFGFTAQVANNIAGLAGADLAETGRDWANRGIRAIEWPVLRHQ